MDSAGGRCADGAAGAKRFFCTPPRVRSGAARMELRRCDGPPATANTSPPGYDQPPQSHSLSVTRNSLFCIHSRPGSVLMTTGGGGRLGAEPESSGFFDAMRSVRLPRVPTHYRWGCPTTWRNQKAFSSAAVRTHGQMRTVQYLHHPISVGNARAEENLGRTATSDLAHTHTRAHTRAAKSHCPHSLSHACAHFSSATSLPLWSDCRRARSRAIQQPWSLPRTTPRCWRAACRRPSSRRCIGRSSVPRAGVSRSN